MDEKNVDEYLYRYIFDKSGKSIQINPENKSQVIGKMVKMRSPLFCNGKMICNKCAGDKFYLVGIKNVGLTAGVVGSSIMGVMLAPSYS